MSNFFMLNRSKDSDCYVFPLKGRSIGCQCHSRLPWLHSMCRRSFTSRVARRGFCVECFTLNYLVPGNNRDLEYFWHISKNLDKLNIFLFNFTTFFSRFFYIMYFFLLHNMSLLKKRVFTLYIIYAQCRDLLERELVFFGINIWADNFRRFFENTFFENTYIVS